MSDGIFWLAGFKINLMKRLPATHLSQGVQYFPIVFGGNSDSLYSAVNLWNI